MRLYKAQYVGKAAATLDTVPLDELCEPDGWRKYATERWGVDFARWENGYKPFFPPSDQPIYRSRSGAQNRVNLINRWFGEGSAILVETEVEWMPTAIANRRREIERRAKRIAKLKQQIEKLEGVL